MNAKQFVCSTYTTVVTLGGTLVSFPHLIHNKFLQSEALYQFKRTIFNFFVFIYLYAWQLNIMVKSYIHSEEIFTFIANNTLQEYETNITLKIFFSTYQVYFYRQVSNTFVFNTAQLMESDLLFLQALLKQNLCHTQQPLIFYSSVRYMYQFRPMVINLHLKPIITINLSVLNANNLEI